MVLLEGTEWTPTDTSIPIDVVKYHTPRRCTIQIHATVRYINKAARIIPPQTFEEYCQQTTIWEQELMKHITWHRLPFEIMEYLTKHMPTDERLLIVSDGSSIEKTTMSFGVVIGTSSGTTLLEAMGPSSGEASSHRAECTGCLAGIVILLHLSAYTSIRIPREIEVLTISDNQGMITSLTERMKYNIGYTNTTLATDWDLLEEIHQTYKTLDLPNHSYKWVQGHQDTKTKKALLVEAQYNVRADQLASEYIYMVNSHMRHTTPLLNHTRCVFRLNGTSCNGKYISRVRAEAARAPYYTYLQQRHGWSASVLNDVDWASFHMAARNYEGNPVQLLKIVHDKLPTNLLRSRYNPSIRPHCHFCCHPETLDHLCISKCNERSIQFSDNA